jgi:hypothetical protein
MGFILVQISSENTAFYVLLPLRATLSAFFYSGLTGFATMKPQLSHSAFFDSSAPKCSKYFTYKYTGLI